MKSLLFTLATLVACVSRVSAQENIVSPPPVGTFGHTTVLANNTIFIQGGSTSGGALSKASYAIILDQNNSLKNATWLDTATLSAFTPRSFGVAAATDNVMVTCGTDDGAQGTGMNCNQFDVIWYNNTNVDPANVLNRGGMAVAYQKSSKSTRAYLVGGRGSDGNNVATVDVLTIPTGTPVAPTWSKGVDLGINTFRYHTATWVDNTVGGIVVLGGQDATGTARGLISALVFNQNKWTSRPVAPPPNIDAFRYGHSAVNDGSGNIFIFGGFDSLGAVRNELFVIDTKQGNWSMQLVGKAPEGRAFHTATMLPGNQILIMWGQNGAGANTAQNTYMLYNIGSKAWTAQQDFPTISVTTQSPNTPKPVKGPNGSGSGSGSGGINVPLIAGLCAAGVLLLFLIIILILLIRRRNRRNRSIPTYHPAMMGKKDMASPPYEEEDKAKQATAFMIRRPPSVYVVDDQDPDNEIPHPNYKSQYYGDSASGRDSPSVAEYELHGAGRNNTLSTVSSVAERRRYVEEQQRQFREGYENAYNHPPPFDSNSRDERDYDMDDEDDLSSNARRNDGVSRNNTGPRYPRAETSRRGQQASGYEHPADDYFV